MREFACTSRDIVSSECNYESGAQTLWRICSKFCGDVTSLTPPKTEERGSVHNIQLSIVNL